MKVSFPGSSVSRHTIQCLVFALMLAMSSALVVASSLVNKGGIFHIELASEDESFPVLVINEAMEIKLPDGLDINLTGMDEDEALAKIRAALINSYEIKAIAYFESQSLINISVLGDIQTPGKYPVPAELSLAHLNYYHTFFNDAKFDADFTLIRDSQRIYVPLEKLSEWSLSANDVVLISLQEKRIEKMEGKKAREFADPNNWIQPGEPEILRNELEIQTVETKNSDALELEPDMVDKSAVGVFSSSDRSGGTVNYRLQPGDVLIVRLPEESGFDQEFLINRSGHILLPEVGEVDVKNVDIIDTKKKIKDKLSEYFLGLNNLEVHLKEKKILITVLGYVENPGEFLLPSTANIQMAINEAGGFREGAQLNTIKLQRNDGEQIIDFRKYLNSGDEHYLPTLQSLDTIFVPSSPELGNIYGKSAEEASIDPTQDKDAIKVIGEVIKPGSLAFKENMTAVDALLLAGGVTRYADDQKIRVINEGKPSSFSLAEFMKFGQVGEKQYLSKGATIYVPIKDESAVLADDPTDNPDSIKVFGEVAKPGVHKYKENISLVDILLLSGGVTRYANVEQIRLIADGEPILFNLKSYLDNGEALPEIGPGSTIFVPKQVDAISSGESVVYIMGQVHKPGAFETGANVNFMDVLANAGGPTRYADTTSIRVLRKTGEVLKFNLDEFSEGRIKEMPEVFKGDSILVPKKSGEDQGWLKFRSDQTIKIVGAVNKPGRYPWSQNIHFMDLFAHVGGANEKSDIAHIKFIYPAAENGETRIETFNLQDFIRKGADASNVPELVGGLTIVVPELPRSPIDNKSQWIMQSKEQSVYIIGEINSPGRYAFNEELDFIDLLTAADGPTEAADLSNIRVVHRGGDKNRVRLYDLRKYFVTGNDADLPVIKPGDSIYISSLEGSLLGRDQTITVLGEVVKTGQFSYSKDLTIVDVITRAGGTKVTADIKKVIIRRDDGNQLVFDLEAYMENPDQQSTPGLLPGDTVYVSSARAEEEWLKFTSDQTIKVVGAINQPGRYPWSAGINFMDLFAHAGGANEKSDISHIKLIYPSVDGERKIVTFNLQDFILEGTDDSELPEVVGGLTVVVPELPRSPIDNKSQWVMQPKENSIYIIGEINEPGRYAFNDKLDFIDILTAADGPTENADLSNIRVVHRDGDKTRVKLYDLRNYFATGDDADLPRVKPGDSIYISARDSSLLGKDQTITLLGEVEKTGRFSYSRDLNILDLISQAGGTKPRANTKKVIIRREGSDHLIFDLDAYMVNPDQHSMPGLLPGDTVYVSPLGEGQEWLRYPSEQTVKVVGAVNQPGRFPWSEDIDFMDMFAQAGGSTEKSDIAHIKLIYPARDGENKIVTFNLQDFIRSGKEHSKLPELVGGLTIVVPELPRSPVDNKSQWIMQPRENSIYIIGEVHEPGRYAFNEKLDFIDILSASDGPTENADLSNVRVVHRDRDKKRVSIYDVRKYFLTGDEADLPVVKPGDSIYISSRDVSLMGKDETITVLGEVENTGRFSYTKNITIIDLISQAGGTKDTADIEKVIVRREGDHQLIFDLEAYMEHPERHHMPELLPGDIVYVSHLRDSWVTVGWNFLKDVTQVLPLLLLLGL